MYITCEQCSTIYRLDETLLKPSGSKVRCSQCRYVFVAVPPETEPAEMDQLGVAGEPVGQYQDTFDQELDGIDVAELDSILEQGRSADASAALIGEVPGDEDDELVEFNEADLDMDFESAFDQDEDRPAPADGVSESSDQELEASLFERTDDIDLDMDFELDDGDEVFAPSLISEEADLDVDLDMDFNLDDGFEGEGSEDIQALDEDDIAVDVDTDEDVILKEDVVLNEDVELALDEFEDVLGGAVGTMAQDLAEVETGEEEVELDIEFDDEKAAAETDEMDADGIDLLLDDTEEVIDSNGPDADLGIDNDKTSAVPKTEGNDLDLSGLDALLDEEVDDSAVEVSEPEELELTLDDDFDLEKEPAFQEALNEDDATIATSPQADIDDLDLTDLDDLLGVDGELDDIAVSKGEKLDLDDDLELSLDDEAVLDDALDEPETAAVTDDTDVDDLDLAGLDDLLDEDEEPVDAAVSEGEELSLDDDLELSLDDEAVLEDVLDESEATAFSDDAKGDDLDLAGLDDLLDEDEGQAEGAVSEGEELSLDDDLELSLDDETVLEDLLDESEETALSDSELGDDLDLAGLDDLLDEDEGQVEGAVSEGEELSLDDDLELSLDEEPELESSVAPAVTAGQDNRDEFDLSDFEELLVEDAAPEEDAAQLDLNDGIALGAESAQDSVTDDLDDFDMSEIDGLLDEDIELDDDLELELDSDSSEEDKDDIDFSGLEETLLDEDDSETPKASDEEMTLSMDDDDIALSLDEDELETTEATSAETGDLEDLEFELDAEFEDKPIAQNAELSAAATQDAAQGGDPVDEALDLSDIEKMLEDDTIVPETSGTTQGLEMDSEVDEGDKWEDDIDDDLGLEGDEIDLSDIEEAINAADEDKQDATLVDDEQELEFDIEAEESKEADASDEFEFELEMEDSPSLAPEGSEKEESDALDLSDFELSMEDDKSTPETETVDGGDIQLEFQIEENRPDLEDEERLAASRTTAAASITSGFMQKEKDFSVEETIATEPIQEQPALETVKAPKKKGMNKALLVLILLLVLLIAGGYFGYSYVVKNDIQIPYISDFINPEAKDPSGVMQLATLEINSNFIENQVEGRLFVVTGKVRNGYPISRKLIRLKGKLYTKGKVLAKTELSFAGLVMADQELSSKPMAEIKKSLNSTIGQDAAITVAAGNTAPFMVVFSKLPDDLDEFVIELVSSIKAQ
jgi:predicted Zn finger-like uncharacterized protein